MTPVKAEIDKFTAAELMSKDVLSVHQDLGVHELADFLAENEITGVPVVGDEDELVGVVSATDIAGKSRIELDFTVERSDPRFYVRAFGDQLDVEEMKGLHIENEEQTVRDIMTPAVLSVGAGTPVPEIAREMVAGHVHRLFVTRDGKVVGIVSALDLVKLLIGD
ncbi:MAG TPA: CBS domain-containing protein [Thermoanaerobaculia bacterium]|nr:CBS domain-containing protein [Thermoanaerobaculia bacterium]